MGGLGGHGREMSAQYNYSGPRRSWYTALALHTSRSGVDIGVKRVTYKVHAIMFLYVTCARASHVADRVLMPGCEGSTRYTLFACVCGIIMHVPPPT